MQVRRWSCETKKNRQQAPTIWTNGDTCWRIHVKAAMTSDSKSAQTRRQTVQNRSQTLWLNLSAVEVWKSRMSNKDVSMLSVFFPFRFVYRDVFISRIWYIHTEENARLMSGVKRANNRRWVWSTRIKKTGSQSESSQDLGYMRHFTASTAIRQDGPLALSTLTGVVSILCGSSCLRAVKDLHSGLNWSNWCHEQKVSLSFKKCRRWQAGRASLNLFI